MQSGCTFFDQNVLILLLTDKIYSGKGNSLVLSRKYYAEYGCTFDLRSFPFDDQRCTMNFTMDSAKADYIVLKSENITYQVYRNIQL